MPLAPLSCRQVKVHRRRRHRDSPTGTRAPSRPMPPVRGPMSEVQPEALLLDERRPEIRDDAMAAFVDEARSKIARGRFPASGTSASSLSISGSRRRSA